MTALVCALGICVSANVSARDLVGVRGTVLPDDQTIVLTRVTRLSADTFLVPDVPPTEEIVATETLDEPNDLSSAQEVDAGMPVQLDPQMDDPVVEDVMEVEAIAEPVIEDEGAPEEPSVEEVELASLEGDIDVSDVEMFDPSIYAVPEGRSFEEEFYDSSLFSRQTGPDLPLPNRGAPPGQNSTGLSGYFAGVASAERMVLLLDVRETDIFGLFADSAAQEFSIRGELLNEQGQARLVIFANDAVGVLEVQLTTLGLSTVYIPLGEGGAPDPASTRSYDFVRVLSPEARRALEELRLANIDRREAEIRAREELEANSRLRFPGDTGSFD